MLLHVIADFGHADLAFAEVVQRLAVELPEARPVATVVPPFATLAAGFCAAQLATSPAPPGMAVFHNVAPRLDDRQARRDNDGERLACARLPNGVTVVGVHAGYAFSFLWEVAEELRWLEAPSAGSQFRSRDLFPAALAHALRGRGLGERLPRQAVPEVPAARVAYVDGFGNLKTTLSSETAPEPGATVAVRIAGHARRAVRAGGGFAVPQGALALAPGSSGWPLPSGGRRTWMELFLRGGSAWEAFGRPQVGAELELTPLAAGSIRG